MTTETEYTGERFLRAKQVIEIVGFSKTYLYKLIEDERFPAPIRIDHRCSRWIASEVEEWVEAMATRAPRGTGKPRGAAIGGAK